VEDGRIPREDEAPPAGKEDEDGGPCRRRCPDSSNPAPVGMVAETTTPDPYPDPEAGGGGGWIRDRTPRVQPPPRREEDEEEEEEGGPPPPPRKAEEGSGPVPAGPSPDDALPLDER